MLDKIVSWIFIGVLAALWWSVGQTGAFGFFESLNREAYYLFSAITLIMFKPWGKHNV